MITFEWTTGAASGHMYRKLKDLGFTVNYKFFEPYIMLNGREVFLDYRHLKDNTYEIVQKIRGFRSEPTYKSIEL